MKKIVFLIGSIAFFSFMAGAQQPETTPTKVNKLDIEVVYNHYVQDGNNSAVTGGEGTEKLTVYGPALNFKKTKKNNAIGVNLGVDIISSASTDAINFIESSASRIDARIYANATVEHSFDKIPITMYGGIGFSIESDYTSIGYKLGAAHTNKEKLRTFSVALAMYNDDLRWGRITRKYTGPLRLIYPSELRYKEWYETYKRNTYSITLGFSQAINKRNVLAVFPQLTLQRGLLATPFHRIYFNDGSQGVEQLPGQRNKFGLATTLNSFVGGKTIIKNSVQLYTDNFGINSIALENETIFKLSAAVALGPNVRWYTQNGSPYFAPILQHSTAENYYTSDYDLASFSTVQLGAVAKYKPYKMISKQVFFNTIILRYAYLHRSNQLVAHIISVGFQLAADKNGQ